MSQQGPQIMGQTPLEFVGSAILTITLFFSCLFIGMFIVYILFDAFFS